jgi:hypothetical protein
LVALLLLSLATATPASSERLQHVTVISDSVAASLNFNPAAKRIVADGATVDFELASCRRLTTLSCPADGAIPPNALQLVHALGKRLGSDVVVAVGYNDDPAIYAHGIDETLQALRRVGVQRVFWLTLHASRHVYVESNAAIWAAARTHHEMTVVDWNAYSRSHPAWFQPDNVHLEASGALGLARLIHLALLRAGVNGPLPAPIDVTLQFPTASVTPGFEATLHATGGTPPYRWSAKGLPPKLTLERTGKIVGRTFPDGHYVMVATARDAHGRTGSATFDFRVSP